MDKEEKYIKNLIITNKLRMIILLELKLMIKIIIFIIRLEGLMENYKIIKMLLIISIKQYPYKKMN